MYGFFALQAASRSLHSTRTSSPASRSGGQDTCSHQIGFMSSGNDHPLSVHSILSKISMPLIVGKFMFSKKQENLTKFPSIAVNRFDFLDAQ